MEHGLQEWKAFKALHALDCTGARVQLPRNSQVLIFRYLKKDSMAGAIDYRTLSTPDKRHSLP